MLHRFQPLTNDSRFPALVFVGADWCGHCQQTAPEVLRASKALSKRGIQTYVVDGDKRPKLVERLGVDGFPTIFVVLGNRRIIEYTGARAARDIATFTARASSS